MGHNRAGRFSPRGISVCAQTTMPDDDERRANLLDYKIGAATIDTSLSPKTLLVPDFKCSTHFFAVENEVEAKTYGDTDAYYY